MTVPAETLRTIRRPRRGAPLLATIVAALLLVGGGLAFLIAPGGGTYESTATVMIDHPRGIAIAPDAGVIDKLSRLRFKYAGLVRTHQFAAGLTDVAGLPPDVVDGALFTGVDPSSLLMTVGARTDDPAMSRRIAQAAATRLTDYVKREQAGVGIAPQNRYRFAVVTDAGQAYELPSPARRAGIAGMILGLAGLVVAAVLRQQSTGR